MFKFFKKLFKKPSLDVNSNDSLFSTLNELENYDRKSWQEIIEDLNKPRKKSDFVIQSEKKLGLNLPECY
jgi:hypothetical protein